MIIPSQLTSKNVLAQGGHCPVFNVLLLIHLQVILLLLSAFLSWMKIIEGSHFYLLDPTRFGPHFRVKRVRLFDTPSLHSPLIKLWLRAWKNIPLPRQTKTCRVVLYFAPLDPFLQHATLGVSYVLATL